MRVTVRPVGRGLTGVVRVPGDKSISHRAAILGALAEGKTEIEGFLAGRDCLATLRILAQLGVEVERPAADRVLIRGRGGRLCEPEDVLNAANSGTTARLMLGVLAGMDGVAILTGDRSLRRRPMGRVTQPLSAMGAAFLGREGAGRLPLAIRGSAPLRAGEFRLPVASAQVKSALLLAGLQAEGVTRVWEPQRSRDHTERMLPGFGCSVEKSRDGGLAVTGPAHLSAERILVPADPSSAFFFVVAAALVPQSELRLPGVGLNPTRLGALAVLRRMGAQIEVEERTEENGEPRGTLVVRSAPLRSAEILPEEVPSLIDEVPALAVAAAGAEGTTVFRGVGELRHKESDRLAALEEGLRQLGSEVEAGVDSLRVTGGRLGGGVVRSQGDHRIAMALAVAGLASQKGVEVRGAECVAISFPEFFALLASLAPGSL